MRKYAPHLSFMFWIIILPCQFIWLPDHAKAEWSVSWFLVKVSFQFIPQINSYVI